MTDIEKKKKLNEAVEYFDELINLVVSSGIEGVDPTKAILNYNTVKQELATLYVDVD